MSNHDVERAYLAAVLDGQADRLDRARAAMQADLDRLRDDWSSSFAAEKERVAERMQKAQADHRAWLESLYSDADDGAQDVAEGQGDAPAGRNAPATPGPVPQQPHHPHAAELERVRAIRDMPMAEYARLRADMGVRSATDISNLFGETR